jgi:allantoinase
MASHLDLLIRNGSVVTPEGVAKSDVGIAGGKFVKFAPAINDPAEIVIDAAGLHVFPGILDAHVHFNEPGRTEWEGLATGSAALAAGGGTWFADMPLNSTPPVIYGASFAEKRRLAEQKSVVDFSLWGGLVPGNLDKLGELHDAGAIALKAFMCGSGVDEFPGVTDPATLRAGMKRAAALGLMVAVHAEDEALAQKFTATQRARGATDVRSWLATRPVEVELSAIRLAVELAGETDCALHIVHVSSPAGLALIDDAKKRGVDVSAETCPHYLLLNEEDVIRTGALAKCFPIVRPEASRQELWRRLAAGSVDTIGSDHSPAPPDMKTSPDFFAIWGGISGCQHGFQLLLSEALKNGGADGPALPALAALLAANVAKRFRLAGKGRLAEGFDADFTLLDLKAPHTLHNSELLYRYKQGPYDGRRCDVQVRQTFVRGRCVWHGGSVVSEGRPVFLRPKNQSPE